MKTISILTVALGCMLSGSPAASAAPGFDAGVLFAPASYIGVGVLDVSDDTARQIGLVEPHGVEICSVADESPAKRSGLREGDIVLSYRGEQVQGYEHFARLVRETPVGRTVELDLVRDRKRQQVQLETGERQPSLSIKHTLDSVRKRIEAVKDEFGSARLHIETDRLDPGARRDFGLEFSLPTVSMRTRNSRLGTDLESLDGQLAEYFGVERGVLVRGVSEDSAAQMAGLRAGDVIVAVEGKPVDRPSEVGRFAAEAGDSLVVVEIVRNREKASLKLDARARPTPLHGRPVSRQK